MKSFTAGPNENGVRLSRFVEGVTKDMPRSMMYKAFRNKRIKVNGKRAEPDTRLSAGDLIELYINDEFFPVGKPTAKTAKPRRQPPVTVVYEDENFAVLYKPAHLLCHSDRTGDANLVDAFAAYLEAKGEYDPHAEKRFAPALCNRLDRGTEGLVLAAKSYAALRDLNAIIRDDMMKKEYLINNLKRGQGVFRVGFYLPVITSWVIVSLVFQYMFNNSNRGLINYILVDVLHVLDDYVPWLLREWSGNAAIWLMGIWKNVGWSMLIYLAALQSIPKERYEAAELDGAGLWARFRYITMPSLRPTTFYVMVNMIIGSFNVFIQVMMLTGGNPNGKTSTLQYLLYDKAFNQFAFGEASAIGMISAVTIVILTVILNRTLKLNSTEQEG